ncbi:MAG TPA: hypothetical protein VFC19_24955 [Candidatus Limnocylindrales bacterium]|nr:hypothetical protein [Candidatus Limnocylindrales bacterium]
MRIASLRLRGILDSRARVTVEAELTLGTGVSGCGSSPRAIAPGRLERMRGPELTLGTLPDNLPAVAAVQRALVGVAVSGQRQVDNALAGLDVGADVTLAVSLAFARAAAAQEKCSLRAYLTEMAGAAPAIPRLMVNVFSGGIHVEGATSSFQQVMVIPAGKGLAEDIDIARAVYAAAERIAEAVYGHVSMSASSGLLIPADSERQLQLLVAAMQESGHAAAASIGVDVAAEHLACPGGYRFGDGTLSSDELAGRLVELAVRYPLTYLEDPFDPDDKAGFAALRQALPPYTSVVGDDLFATNASLVDSALADGMLLKLSQAGTVSATVDAARAARRAGMVIAVSHRSGETEDTAMCDLAVAVGADLIKVGGPRRGDRLAKYNHLLRLQDDISLLSAV